MDYSCLKCGSKDYQLKNVYFPEKNTGIVSFEVGLYYLKICAECGFVEIYSAKIVDKEKNEKSLLDFSRASV